MTHEDDADDVAGLSRAIATLRKRFGISQEAASQAHEDDISKQYWGMHERGGVPGIVKPATQRKLLAAISKAAGLAEPLTLQDLQAELAAPSVNPAEARALRMAGAFTPRGAPAGRQAVFPLSTGDAVVQLPAAMTPEACAELEAYLQALLKGIKGKLSRAD